MISVVCVGDGGYSTDENMRALRCRFGWMTARIYIYRYHSCADWSSVGWLSYNKHYVK